MRSADDKPEAEPSYLVVRTGGSLCALPLGQAREVLRPVGVEPGDTRVPALRGMMMLRGTPTPVLDLAMLLGLRVGAGEGGAGRLVSVRFTNAGGAAASGAGQAGAALAVDEVLGLFRLPGEDVRGIELPGGRSEQALGFDGGFARLVEAGGLLSAEEWERLQARVGEP